MPRQNGLFSVVATLLLIGVKATNFPENTNPKADTFLTLLSYASPVFCISATVTSLILADRLGEIPIRASTQSELAKEGSVQATPTYLLKRYGAGSAWTMGVWHCKLFYSILRISILTLHMCAVGIFCMLAGIWCILIEFLVYIFLLESRTVKIIMTCLLTFSTTPFLLFLLLPNGYGRNSDSDSEGN